jgi:Protein of unknown function (DUF1579)
MKIGSKGLLIAATIGLAAAMTAAQDSKQDAKAADKEKAMMEAWQKAATPGDAHKKLEPFVGTFDARVRMWSDPDPSKAPEDSTGTMTSAWVLGNRYVQQNYEGTFMGQPFNGIGYVGYDNVSKKIQSIWMDSAATGMMWMTGTADAAGKVVSTKGTMSDPMSGRSLPVEDKITIADNDHMKMEMWTKGAGGKMMKVMEIEYTRKK